MLGSVGVSSVKILEIKHGYCWLETDKLKLVSAFLCLMDLTHALATNAVEVKDCLKYVKLKSNKNVLFTAEVTEMASCK